ncbi:MAG: YggS family pyridoxal phosphate-dependent enzyme [Nitrospirae bacterium]|nr:YggS family pyridoxal phosphate-dependent enzyme [Nitrospirota bacterium]
MGVRENLSDVLERIDAAARRSGRKGSDIALVAVTKTVEPALMLEAAEAGAKIFGENRVREAEEKKAMRWPDGASWHMIGHLQRNKAKTAAGIFDMIQSVDSVELARHIDRHAGAIGKTMPVLLEINMGSEESKTGFPPDGAFGAADEIAAFKNIKVEGLMAIPPYCENPEDARPYFRRLAGLRKEFEKRGHHFRELSMGMSHDFEAAIEEGATIVRVGTAIFGGRHQR